LGVVVIEFKVTLSNLGYLITELTKLIQSTGKPYRVTCKEYKETRSLSQNALMWKWLAEIDKQAPLLCDSKISGAEMWHEVFKHYYCPVKTVKNERASLSIKSTKMLDLGEMTFYLNKIENWCFDRGVKLTIPSDSKYAKLMENQTK
jgi:hypothetical protein